MAKKEDKQPKSFEILDLAGLGFEVLENKEIEDVDYNSVADVVAGASATLRNVVNLREKEAIKYFRLGVLLSNISGNPDMPSLREIGEYLNFPYRTLGALKELADYYKCDESKFKEEYQEFRGKNIFTFYKRKLRPDHIRKVYKTIGAKFRDRIDSLIAQYLQGSISEDGLKDLKNLQKKLNRTLPVKASAEDIQGLEYSYCVGCGAVNETTQPFELIRDKDYSHIQYPLCEECKEKDAKPNYKLLSKLLTEHIIRMEEIYADISSIYGGS